MRSSLTRSATWFVVLGVTLATRLPAQPPAAAAAMPATLDTQARASVLDSIRAQLLRSYVDADTGRRIAAFLTQRQQAKAYDSLTDRRQFASAVTADLRALNGDKHLILMTALAPAGRMAGPPPAPRGNFGLSKVEVLDGNIGYLEVAGFDEAPGAFEAVGDALRTLERTGAIIIDLRRNGGGSGEMSHLLFSHFLAETPVPTIRIRDRRDGTDTILTSVGRVTGPRRTTVPLYVLTSRFSASAAEEFAFVLRNKGRATVVGERTAGAGHMNAIVPIGHGFQLSVSTTRVSDAVTGAEWEKVGVAPNIEATSATALDVALQLARKAAPSPAGAALR
jgi:Peptidase family S41